MKDLPEPTRVKEEELKVEKEKVEGIKEEGKESQKGLVTEAVGKKEVQNVKAASEDMSNLVVSMKLNNNRPQS